MTQLVAEPTLTVRVGQVIADEHLRVLERCEREPHVGRSKATKRESDMRAWGMTFGVAYGLLLAADPEGDVDTMAEDALDGARAAFARWSGTIAPRQAHTPPMDAMLEAYGRVERELAPLQDTADGRRFLDKMQGLIEAIGMPEPEVID
jgi:hypothetical protein